MRRVTNHCDAQTELFEWTSLQPFHGGDVVTCFDVVGCRERWSNAVGCEVMWGEVMWLVARCHVMSCDVIWCVFILCDAISCVVWCPRNALRCHVMSSHVMSCHLFCEVMRCNGMRSYEFVMHCGWLRCHVVVVRNGCVGWIGRWSGDPNYTESTPYYTVLQSTTPVLLCATQYYCSTTLYYKVPVQYYSVLQRTTPVLVCTTKYYSSTTLYYKVLLQYYSVLQKYYSSTSLYYKVLLQYYSVLHRTTPVLLCTTKYYSSTNSVLQSTTPVLLYYKVLLQYYSLYYKVRICKARSTNVTKCCQRHQILHLPRKMTLMSDVRHKWNVIYNARSNRCHPPTSPSTVPATKDDSHH